jgi:TPP-dependent pyruvate/acetoin dehydrogenase alpha subunit
MAAGILTDAAWSDMEGSVRGEVAAATERALTQPFPDPSTVLDHVLAGPAEVRDVR